MFIREISRIAAIIKHRFSEVVLIVALMIMAQVCAMQAETGGSESFSDKLPLLSFGIIAAVTSIILSCGFLRSICYEPFHKHLPADLLKIGKSFFWRMVGYALLTGVFAVILLLPIFLIAGKLFAVENSQPEIPGYFFNLSLAVVGLVLFKPSVFIPAFILARDTGVFESLKSLKIFNAGQVRPVFALFVVQISISFLSSFLPVSRDKNIMAYYAVTAAVSVIGQILSLMVAVGAVRFVLSLDGRTKDLSKPDEGNPGNDEDWIS